jgi:hypothetical protein
VFNRLAEQGHHVVGLEASETAILQFFESRGLGKEVKQLEGIENGKLYTVRLLSGSIM